MQTIVQTIVLDFFAFSHATVWLLVATVVHSNMLPYFCVKLLRPFAHVRACVCVCVCVFVCEFVCKYVCECV